MPLFVNKVISLRRHETDRFYCFLIYLICPFQTVFTLAPFPYRKVGELREKYTYDIHPFSTFGQDNSTERISGKQGKKSTAASLKKCIISLRVQI